MKTQGLMMSTHKTRLYKFLLFIIPTCIGIVATVHVLLVSHQLAGESTIACAEGLHAGMSGDEIADLFGIPLVDIHPVPDFMESEPQIRLAVYYPIESAVCGIEIQYFSRQDNAAQISISIFHASGSSTDTDWHCIDFDEEIASASGSFTSVCSRTLAINDENLFVSIFTQETSDGTLEYTNRLEWSGD